MKRLFWTTRRLKLGLSAAVGLSCSVLESLLLKVSFTDIRDVPSAPTRNNKPVTQSSHWEASKFATPLASQDLLDQAVKLLFPNDEVARNYSLTLSDGFLFYVYEDLPSQYTYPNISKCLEDYAIKKRRQRKVSNDAVTRTREEFYEQHCDWGSSICNPSNHTKEPHYSERRLNRNADVVMAKLFLEYTGPLRTYNVHDASVIIVPYPASSQKECFRVQKQRKLKAALTNHERGLLRSLPYWNNIHLVICFSIQQD